MPDPSQLLQTVLQAGQAQSTPFLPTSRYYGLGKATLVTPSGQTVLYLLRRFVPSPDEFALLQLHVVTQNERLDNITAKYLGDPEQFWRVCDANAAMRPDDLTRTVGFQLRITLPQGVPATPNA